MSSLFFPSGLKGLDIEVTRTSQFATLIQTGASGKEQRASFWTMPRWTYEWTLNFVRQAGFSAKTLSDELMQLASFFNTMRGAWDSFYFIDPVNGNPVAVSFGTGTGAQASFPLVDNEGFPVGIIQSAAIYKNDWQGCQLLSPNPRTNYLGGSYNSVPQQMGPPTNLTITSGISDPAGGSNAFTLTATAANANVQGYGGGVPPGNYCSSVWLRRRTGSGAVLISGPTVANAPVAVNITSSWQRFYLSGPYNSTYNVACLGIYLAVSGDQADVAFGQVEPGTTPTSYIPTLTALPTTVTDYALNSTTGIVTFSTAPASGAALTWTGQFARICRFVEDTIDFKRFMQLAWDGGTVKVITLK